MQFRLWGKYRRRRFQFPHHPTKVSDWTVSPTKTALGDLQSVVRSLPTPWEQKLWELIAWEEKENNCILTVSFHPPSQHCSAARRKFPAQNHSSHQERQSRVSDQLLQAFRALLEGFPSVSPHPDQQSGGL